MATYKLKNGATDSGTVPGIGSYTNGVLENAPDNFENPNFEKVEAAAPAPAPAPTVTATPVTSTSTTTQTATPTQGA